MAKKYYFEEKGIGRGDFIIWRYVLDGVYHFLLINVLVKHAIPLTIEDHGWTKKIITLVLMVIYFSIFGWLMYARGQSIGFSRPKNISFLVAVIFAYLAPIFIPTDKILFITPILITIIIYPHFIKPANYEMSRTEDKASSSLRIWWGLVAAVTVWVTLKDWYDK